jgi:mono/diheme cytochrome c family protein
LISIKVLEPPSGDTNLHAKRSNKGDIMVQVWGKRPASVTAVIAGFFLLSVGVQAQTGGDAMRGSSLAESWCQSCHIIDQRGTGRAVDPAPPFPMIANDPKKTPGYLQHWLSTSHPQMPNFNLGRREIEDLIAYIRSLAASPEKSPRGERRMKKRHKTSI